MALLPRYAGDDWLQVVVIAIVESPSSGYTLLAAGFSGPETAGPLQHPVA
jgi:hypothetical protein